MCFFLCFWKNAREKAPHTAGENLTKPAAVEMARILCDDDVTNKLAMVPLSNDTMKRRIQEMSEDVLQQTIASVKRSGNFSLQLDETVAYAESFRGGQGFFTIVTSQINLGSAEGTTIIGWSGGMPRKNFAKLHLKIRILVPVKSEAFQKPKKHSHSGGYSNSGVRRKNFQKFMFYKKKALISSFTFFSQHLVDL